MQHRDSLLITLVGIVLLAATLAGGAWSQPGTVLSQTKINSDTLVSFGAAMSNRDEFGDSVCNLGDLDGAGPGVAAIAVGAIGDDDNGSRSGSVYLLFLNSAGYVRSMTKITSGQGNFTGVLDIDDEFGGAVTSLGDLDGPGPSVLALAVGAIGDDDGGATATAERGAVWVLFLSATGSVLSHTKISDTQGNFTATLDDGDELGGALTSLGDLDGPGPSVAALAVGAAYDDDGGVDSGAVYILFLSSAGTVLSHQKISTLQGNLGIPLGSSDNFGEDLGNLGDLDGAGPGVRTLMATAVQDDDGGTHRGAAYVLFLNSTGTVRSRQKISDTQGNFTATLFDEDNFGSGVAPLGDIDGPGGSATAVAVSAGGADGLGLDRGAIFVLFLNSAGSVVSHQEISETAGGFTGVLDDVDEFGSAMAALGDINGGAAGVQTLASAASFDDDGGQDRGAVYLLTLSGSASVGVGDAPAQPIGLRQVRPNPFARATTIPFRTAEAGLVRIEVWDAGGRRVRGLLESRLDPGEHQVAWDGRGDSGRPLGPGTYFIRMSVNGQALAAGAKTILLR